MLNANNLVGLICDNLVSCILLLVLFYLIRCLIESYLSRRKLPAGPIGLPLLGYLPFLGDSPQVTIAKLSNKYGNVFTLPLGANNVVILNDFDAVKNAFSKDSLLGRPLKPLFSVLGRPKSFADDSGSVWKEHRRFSLHLLRDLGFGKGSMEERIIEEIHFLTERIDKMVGQSADIISMLTPSISNNVSQLVFGHRFNPEDPTRIMLDSNFDQASAVFNPTGLLSATPVWIRDLAVKTGVFGSKNGFQNVFKIFDDEISSHQKNFNENNKRDYMDGYLAHMKLSNEKDQDSSFTTDKLFSNSLAFFGAGSETTRTATEWCLVIAAHYSEFQTRVQSEIDSVVGQERTVAWTDRLMMPFTQAFICEVLRWKTTIPINLYRRTTEDTYILDHLIPKDTLVLANFWAVHNDPKLWDHPDQFNPNRFLTDDGKELTKTEYLIPFSIGKRSCVGETLARVEVFLYFATLLQKYAIRSVNDRKFDFEEKVGLSLQPKHKPLLIFEKRN